MNLINIMEKIKSFIKLKMFNIFYPSDVRMMIKHQINEITNNKESNIICGIPMDDNRVIVNVGIVIFNKSVIYDDIISPLAKFIFSEFGVNASITHVNSGEDFKYFDWLIVIAGYGDKVSEEQAKDKVKAFYDAIILDFMEVDFGNRLESIKYPHIVLGYRGLNKNLKLIKRNKEFESFIDERKMPINTLNAYELYDTISSFYTQYMLPRDTIITLTRIKIPEVKNKKIRKIIEETDWNEFPALSFNKVDFDYISECTSILDELDLIIFVNNPYTRRTRVLIEILTANKFVCYKKYSNASIYYHKKFSEFDFVLW